MFLKPEIDQGLVTVLGDHAMPIVRIRNKGMFPSGSATINSGYFNLLERIGNALKAEKGPVQVIGYTDNQPIHTVRFPSNFQLSTARAEAARDLIVKALGDPDRVTAIGKADADPIAPNTTEDGRDAEPAHRGCAAEARLDHGRRIAIPRLALVPDLHRRPAGRLLIWFFGPFLSCARVLAAARDHHCGAWC